MIGDETTVEGLLSDLIKLDYDAVEAYEAAINRIDNNDYKIKLEEFRTDHLRHTENLGEILQRMNKNTPTGPDSMQILTQGKVVAAEIFGETAILKAMKTNEDETNVAYEKAINHIQVTPEIRITLQQNLEDERKHREWIVEQITLAEEKKEEAKD